MSPSAPRPVGVAGLAMWWLFFKMPVNYFLFGCTLIYGNHGTRRGSAALPIFADNPFCCGPRKNVAAQEAKTSGVRASRKRKPVLSPLPRGTIHCFISTCVGGRVKSERPAPLPPHDVWWWTVGWVVTSPSSPGQPTCGCKSCRPSPPPPAPTWPYLGNWVYRQVFGANFGNPLF